MAKHGWEWNDGFNCYHLGWQIKDNPFEEPTYKWTQWIAGWQAAEYQEQAACYYGA